MSKDFENEFTCDVCQCTYIAGKDGPQNRCKAHAHLPQAVEEEVKYKYKDISNQELMDRIKVLEDKVEDLMVLVKKEKVTYSKKCEDCGKVFEANAPAVKKCPACKKGK